MTKDKNEKQADLAALAAGDSIHLRVTEEGTVVKTYVQTDEREDSLLSMLHDYYNGAVDEE